MHITEALIKVISPVNPLIPSYQKVKQRAQEGQEDDDKHPQNLIIPSKIIHQNTDQGYYWQEYNKKDDEQGHQNTEAEKEKKSHIKWVKDSQ